jgi:hypothetical protein
LVALYVREGKVSRYFGVFWCQKPLNWGHAFGYNSSNLIIIRKVVIWEFIRLKTYEAFLLKMVIAKWKKYNLNF